MKLRLLIHPGSHILPGGTHGRVSPAAALTDELREKVANAAALGPVRTPQQDVEFSLRQLAEIALRTLSPSLNDAFTRIVVIDQLAVSLPAMIGQPEAPAVWADREGRMRVYGPTSRFESLLEAAFNQIRQSGAAQPATLIRIMEKLGQLAELTDDSGQLKALERQARMVLAAGRRNFAEPHDLRTLERRFEESGKNLPSGLAAA